MHSIHFFFARWLYMVGKQIVFMVLAPQKKGQRFVSQKRKQTDSGETSLIRCTVKHGAWPLLKPNIFRLPAARFDVIAVSHTHKHT